VSQAGQTQAASRRRAVVLVGNPAAPYSRGLRIARALSGAGYEVEIAAVAAAGLPDRETDGQIVIRRYAPSGPYRSMAASYPEPATGARRSAGGRSRLRSLARAPLVGAAALRRWLFWPHTVRGWWATLARELGPADLYHACGSLTIAPALAARGRDREAGRTSVAIYDVIDIVAESNNVRGFPGPARTRVASRESGWARASDAITVVNDALADRFMRMVGLAERPTVVPNYPEPWDPPAGRPDLIRAALGLPVTTRIVLFQGRLGPDLGLPESAEAVLRVPDTVLVLIGFGRWYERSRARDDEPRFKGRHFTLPAVHPDELAAWTASADVTLVPLPPISFNQRNALPNKFLEAIVAGTPIVLGPGLPPMEVLLREHDLGRVAASLAPVDLAAAIAGILDRPAAQATADRARVMALAADRFTWPIAAAAYRGLVRRLVEPAA
jgi:glycosyltransferase involved in cell wall biosynthesis